MVRESFIYDISKVLFRRGEKLFYCPFLFFLSLFLLKKRKVQRRKCRKGFWACEPWKHFEFQIHWASKFPHTPLPNFSNPSIKILKWYGNFFLWAIRDDIIRFQHGAKNVSVCCSTRYQSRHCSNQNHSRPRGFQQAAGTGASSGRMEMGLAGGRQWCYSRGKLNINQDHH